MGEIRKIAFLYPGQGAQKTGMAQDFYENRRLREAYLNVPIRFWISLSVT